MAQDEQNSSGDEKMCEAGDSVNLKLQQSKTSIKDNANKNNISKALNLKLKKSQTSQR